MPQRAARVDVGALMAAALAAEPHADVLHELVPRQPLAQIERRHLGYMPTLLANNAHHPPDPEMTRAT